MQLISDAITETLSAGLWAYAGMVLGAMVMAALLGALINRIIHSWTHRGKGNERH